MPFDELRRGRREPRIFGCPQECASRSTTGTFPVRSWSLVPGSSRSPAGNPTQPRSDRPFLPPTAQRLLDAHDRGRAKRPPDPDLRSLVQDRPKKPWNPEQISHLLRAPFPDQRETAPGARAPHL